MSYNRQDNPVQSAAHYREPRSYPREAEHKREAKNKAVTHAMPSNVNRKSHGTNGDDKGDGDSGEDGGGGDDDDPPASIQALPITYHFPFPDYFLSCLLLAGMAWLFHDNLLAAIPLIGLCALCAFSDKLQILKGEVSSRGAKFEIRSKK